MTDHFAIAPLGALDLDRAAALHAESFTALGERALTRQDIAELVGSPGVAGLLRYGAEDARRVACVLTGHGLKDPQTALAHAGSVARLELPFESTHFAPKSGTSAVTAFW